MIRDFDQQRHIRRIYKGFNPKLSCGRYRSPYSLGIDWEFTPIEYNTWAAIRYLGIPMYPEYPIGRYFVDFADILKRIAVEVDSFAYHRDYEKDIKRQYVIEKMGWKLFRIKSPMTFLDRDDFVDEDGNVDTENYVKKSAEGFLWNLYGGEAHYGK